MPKTKTLCDIDGCKNLTNGKLCKTHDLQRRASDKTPQEYRRQWHLYNKYGLTAAEFDAWWIAFKGRCGICGCVMKMPTNTRGQALDVVAVDHDHSNGKVRGLLCNACNKGLGMFKDKIENLNKAIKWLEMCNEKTSDYPKN